MKRVVIIYQLDENKKPVILVAVETDKYSLIVDKDAILDAYSKEYAIPRETLLATQSIACIPDPRILSCSRCSTTEMEGSTNIHGRNYCKECMEYFDKRSREVGNPYAI